MKKNSFVLVVLSLALFGCESTGERAFISKKYTDGLTINLGNIMIGRDGSIHSDPIAYDYCRKLGFKGFKDSKRYDDNAGMFGGHYEITYFCTNKVKNENKVKVNETRTNDSNSLNLDKFKAQCTSLGFKQGTEKYADCVLELSK